MHTSDVHVFSKAQVENEARARWYVRQLLGSCNIGGGRLFHVLSGNLSHQIEHNLFPDLPSNRCPGLAVRVRALASRYGIPYNTGSLNRQFGTTVMEILRLSLPGGTSGAQHKNETSWSWSSWSLSAQIGTMSSQKKPRPKADFGRALQQLRAARSLTQEDMLFATSRRHISRVEQGHQTPSIYTIESLAESLQSIL